MSINCSRAAALDPDGLKYGQHQPVHVTIEQRHGDVTVIPDARSKQWGNPTRMVCPPELIGYIGDDLALWYANAGLGRLSSLERVYNTVRWSELT